MVSKTQIKVDNKLTVTTLKRKFIIQEETDKMFKLQRKKSLVFKRVWAEMFLPHKR